MRLHELRARVAALAGGHAVRAGKWALIGQAAGIAASLANFLLLARLIGPADYGLVAAAWALVLTLGPILTFGADRLVVRDISGSGRDPAEALTASLLTVLGGTGVAAVVIVVLHPLVLPQVPFLLLASIAVADISSVAVAACLLSLCFATGIPRAGGLLTIGVALGKISAVVAFALLDGEDPVVWALLYAGFSLGLVVVELTWAFRRFGRPVRGDYRFLPRAREGLAYSGNQAATMVQNDSDKIVLVRSGYAEETGLYSVAYRLATTAYMPVLAVLTSTYPKFFAVGASGGLTATAALARRLALPLLAYGVVVAVALVVVAPLVPVLVGEQYRGSVPLLMALSVLPLLRVGQVLAGDALTGAGRQGTRTRCFAGSAALNLALNLAFTPQYGVAAALAATFAAELTALVLVHAALRRHRRRERSATALEEAVPADIASPRDTG